MKINAIYITLLLIVCFPFDMFAKSNNTKLIPRVDFYSSDNAWDAKINSAGNLIAYEAPHNGKPSIWIANPKAMESATPLKVGSDFKFRYFKWSQHPDFLIVFADSKGDERWQLTSVNVTSGKLTALSPSQGQRAHLVGFDRNDVNTVMIAHNQRNARYNDLFRVNLTSGKSTLVFKNESGYTDFYTDLNGLLKLANKRRDDQSFDLQLPLSQKSLFSVAFEDTRSFKFLTFANNNESFYVLSAQGRNTAALLNVNLANGKVSTIAASEVADIKEVVFDPISGEPIAYAIDYVNRQWVSLKPKYNSLFQRLSHDFEGRVDVISNALNTPYYTLYISGKRASYYALLDLKNGGIKQLFDAYPALAKSHFSPKVGFTMTTRDGALQTGTFVAAHGSDKDGDGFPDKPTAMILMAHGGPWDQSRPGFDTWQQWLANRGYSIISPNFRASTGLGKQWLNQGNQQWGGVIQHDIEDAINWAVEKGYANKHKIASMGASFGGYVTLRLLTNKPELLACGVSTAASPNLISLYEQLPDYWQAFKQEYLLRVGDATTKEGRELLKSHSPLFFAQDIKKPLLIFHGQNDSRVNIEEPRQIVSAMKKNKQAVHFAVSKNSGHGSSDPDSELAYQAIVEQFFAQCLGGSFEPYHHPLPKSFIEFEAGGEFFETSE